MKQIILASASPRRKELLEQIGLEFEIVPAKGEEVITKTSPEEVEELLEKVYPQMFMEYIPIMEKQ